MNRGSHGRRMPSSSCSPTITVSGPLIAPASPGTGMKAGIAAITSSIPNTRLPRPASSSSSGSSSSGSPTVKAARRARVPASWRARARPGPAPPPVRSPLPGPGLPGSVVIAGRFGQFLHQQLVDARAVQVDHLDPPSLPLEPFAGIGDAPEMRDHHSRGGVEVVLILVGAPVAAEQLPHGVDGDAAVHQHRAVVAGDNQRLGVVALAAAGAADAGLQQ